MFRLCLLQTPLSGNPKTIKFINTVHYLHLGHRCENLLLLLLRDGGVKWQWNKVFVMLLVSFSLLTNHLDCHLYLLLSSQKDQKSVTRIWKSFVKINETLVFTLSALSHVIGVR